MAQSGGLHPIRVMVTFHSLFYIPIYATVASGFFESQGISVSFQTCPPKYAHGLAALNQGAADIVQSGIMRGIIALDWGAESVPPHIAKINSRDGFFLLRQPSDHPFDWSDLSGSRVIPLSFSPMPWASLQFALKNHSIDLNSLVLLHGLTHDQALKAFCDGKADFIHVPEPNASNLIDSGAADLAVALGPENGHVAYSSFATTNHLLEHHPDTMQSFVRGFGKGLEWINASHQSDIADAIGPFFDEIPKDLLVKSVARYKEQGTWSSDPMLREDEFYRQQDILISAGLVKAQQPYSKVVRPVLI